MRYRAVAFDYDGTLAHDSHVAEATLEALRRIKASARKIILVTGRRLSELQEIFPACELFDAIVVENGGTLFLAKTRTETPLAAAPPAQLLEEMTRRGVASFAVGKVIVATWHPYEETVLQIIRDLGLDLQIIFNKGAVMILPAGVNKASGLAAALLELGLSPHNVVGVGDAENDHAFLKMCEASVAVANALAGLKEQCDWVTGESRGAGVEEMTERLLQNDLADLSPKLDRHNIALGEREDGTVVSLPPYNTSVLVAGTSGGGKSTLTNGVIERLGKTGYQYCIIDPEGDYTELEGVAVLGDAKHAPSTREVLTTLHHPAANCVVNLIGVGLADRPAYFEQLLAELLKLQSQTGRPHWLVLDESHHILPVERADELAELTHQFGGRLLVTLEPEHVSRPTLLGMDLIVAIGKEPQKAIKDFSRLVGEEPPEVPDIKLEPGEAIAWSRKARQNAFWFRSYRPALPQKRHIRKYAEGDLGDLAFVFRGPEQKLNLRAQNLMVFLEIGSGVDDNTWNYHLKNGDVERWMRDVIKDPSLAGQVRAIAEEEGSTANASRGAIRRAVEAIYTLPR